MFYRVPVNNGTVDIDYRDLQEGIQTSSGECLVKLRGDAAVRESWGVVAKEDFEAAKTAAGVP